MRIFITSLISLLFLSSANHKEVSSHHVKVEYAMVVKPTAQMNQLPPGVLKTLLEPTYYTLENNGQESLYYQVKGIDTRRDSVKTTATNSEGNKRELTTTITTISSRTSPPTTYKNFENNTILTRWEVDKKAYLTQADFNESPWKIQQETAVIAGMECKRATMIAARTGDEIEAWFAPDIPVYDGPAGYYGLPGLILKVESSNNTIYATRISYPKELTVIKPKGELIAREELLKIQAKALDEARKESETTEERDGDTIIRRKTRGEVIKLN